jgi:hypothetical protein
MMPYEVTDADALAKNGAKITQTHIRKHPTNLLNYI